ncbi:unnamed protein product [Caenorhabditis bovis]|uniref:Uncharacterized protein n=1 Tax=Caenorhabditis bovis TaxID=2654633 RepID=A0A8S1EK59_9PELO|nr:unnamed protein product [Caenorhabditis bovis]
MSHEMEEELHQLRTNASGELMSDEDFIKTIESMSVEAQEQEINSLLKAMHENRIVSWDEAERILQETDKTPVKCSLPEQTRPTEPDNEVDVDVCIRKLLDNDPSLKEVNLNNMKRTPVPAIKRLLEALAYNEHCERISLANMGLYDHDIMVLVTVIEMNQAIKKVNLETNYLSGEFFAKLFKAALVNETVEEIKAVNQGVSFSTQSEKEIIDAIVKNHGLTKISINFRLPEGRHKVENATLRNGEIKRIKRREAALKAKQEAEELAKNPVPHLAPEPKKVPEKNEPVKAPTPVKAPPKEPTQIAPKYMVSPKPNVAPKPLAMVVANAPPKPTILAKQLSFQRASRESEEDTELVAPEKSEIPRKISIPRKFVELSNEPEKQLTPPKAAPPKRQFKQWKPKTIDELDDGPMEEAHKQVTKVPPPPRKIIKKWEPKQTIGDEEDAPIAEKDGPKQAPPPPKRLIKKWEPKRAVDDFEGAPIAKKDDLKQAAPPKRITKKWEPKPAEERVEEGPISQKAPPRRMKQFEIQNGCMMEKDDAKKVEGPKGPPPRRIIRQWEPKPIDDPEEGPMKQETGPREPNFESKKNEDVENQRIPQKMTAKSLWEQRMAKLEKKTEKKKAKPLLSIQKIREMEKSAANENPDILEKAIPKKLDVTPFENGEKETPHKQKIVATKRNSLVEEQKIVGDGIEEKRPTTIIRRTVMRKKEEGAVLEMPKRIVRPHVHAS